MSPNGPSTPQLEACLPKTVRENMSQVAARARGTQADLAKPQSPAATIRPAVAEVEAVENDPVAEWLRRLPAKELSSGGESSNLFVVDILFFFCIFVSLLL